MDWSRLGKKRSRFGQWIDNNGLSQMDVADKTGISRETISRYANNDDSVPTHRNAERIMDVVNEIDEDKTTRDFWEW